MREFHRAIRLQNARLQPFAYEPQKGFVVNALGEHLQEPLVIEMIEGHHDTLPTSTVFPRRSPLRARTTRWWGKRWSCSVGRGANSACICS
jgi:hypothetical protein